MAASKPAQKSTRGLVNRLTAKVGPLPVWAWAAAILAAYFLYSRMRPPAATTTGDTASASTPDGSTGSAQVPASGQGSPADNLSSGLLSQLGANTAAIDALTSQILSQPTPYSNFGDAPAAGTPASDLGYGSGPAAVPTTPSPNDNRVSPSGHTPTPTAVGASPGRGATQTTAGVLKWGGLTFTTKAAFDSWARSHGTTTNAELSNHPQARAIYSTLK